MKRELTINLTIGAVIALTIIVFYFSFYGKQDKANSVKAEQGIPVVKVKVSVAKKGDIEIVRVYTANIEAERALEIKPQYTGQIKNIYIEMGDKVKKNQIIATLDSDGANQLYQQKKAALEFVNVSLEKAELQKKAKQAELEKARSLFEKLLISQKDYDRAEMEFKNAEIDYMLQQAELNQKIADLQQVAILLDDTEIKAPFSGYIGSKSVDTGSVVSAMTTIATLVSIDTVKVHIDVDEKDLTMLDNEMPIVAIVDTYPNRTFEGIIERISPVLDNTTHLGKAQIRIDNSHNLLKPGMSAKIKIVVKSQTDALIIPINAVVNNDGQDIVYTTSGGKAFEKIVKLGVRDEERVEVINGISEGEWVIVTGQDALSEGTRINVQERI
ncbi:MAG: hypothetical protein A2Y62_20050 [Candidatus Fischerbacteria bacterium RBG_13_37_8]|uniref:Uncharacterized protein n=1 Tax=Candidatus Fischerbacteria bacterium RBG_13_37_8 TaxID=1817863 RepID=A0A1F5VTN0_9BACT|nr:MAG: hypothetical protein A2Y62_20050 [Candidatus Fischerbacteria bacterium RBG_13_37_8]